MCVHHVTVCGSCRFCVVALTVVLGHDYECILCMCETSSWAIDIYLSIYLCITFCLTIFLSFYLPIYVYDNTCSRFQLQAIIRQLNGDNLILSLHNQCFLYQRKPTWDAGFFFLKKKIFFFLLLLLLLSYFL